ncbi:MAG: hypothetical protein ACRDTA_24485, partial [Pseudonocardiaceae bacterium]
GRAVKLNGVAVVLAVAVGSVVAGIAGAVLAVPLLAMLNAGIRELITGNTTSVDVISGRVTVGDLFSGAEGNGVRTVGSAFPPADVPAGPDGAGHNGAGHNGAGPQRAGGPYRGGPHRARSGPAHRR